MANARIMIVEDESIVAKDIQNSLTSLGYTVAGVVAFGEEAVELAGTLKPDLILMDVMLKGAMDGIEAATHIQRKHSVPVVYLTAYTDDDTLQRAKVTEAFGYLLKPFEDRELRTTIEMALYKHTMERKQKDALVRECQLQDRLFRSQRLESLGRLAGGVAHNLNNILGPMVNYPDLIAKNLPPDSALRQDLKIIKNSAHKAVDIIRDLLTLGRIGHFPVAPIILNRILDMVLRSPSYLALQHSAPLVVVDLKWAADLSAIQGSEGLLQDMVINLLIHAFDAMPQGGRLTLTTSVEQVREPVAGYELIPPDTYVVLHVLNTGPAIEEQELNQMFEPFYTNGKVRSLQRSGLELAIVYAVIKEHKGFIDVRSSHGKGSDFIVYFPVSGALPEVREQPDLLDFRGNETVLVVDDDEAQRRIVARWLRTSGYKVLTAHNGQAAIELLDSVVQAQGPTIDLVLLDMIMADDFDGLDTYKKMLELNPRQRAIMVSGFTATDRINEALKLGVGQYIQKPYDFEDLGRAVRRELDKS